MSALRSLLAQRHLAMLLCVAALLLKVLIPTGYMIETNAGRSTLIPCSGMAPPTATMEMPAMKGATPHHGRSKDHGTAEMPCPFSGLSAAMTAPLDPIQLAALIAFVMAMGFTASRLPTPQRPARLRPPLRGPPVHL